VAGQAAKAPEARIMQSKKIKLLQILTNFHIGARRGRSQTWPAASILRTSICTRCLRHSGELLAELETLRRRARNSHRPLVQSQDSLARLRLARYVRRNLIQIVHSFGFYPNVFTFRSPGWPGHRSWWPRSATPATC